MKRSRKVLASVLSAVLATSFCVPSAAFASAGDGLLATLQGLAAATVAGDEEAIEHAYDPYAEAEAEEAYQESCDIEEGKVIFCVRDYRADGAQPTYLGSKCDIASEEGLKAVKMVFESVSKTAEKRAGYTAYDVYYEANTKASDVWALASKLSSRDDVLSAEPSFVYGTEAVDTPVEVNSPSSSEKANAWYLNDLKMSQVWKEATSDGKMPGQGVVVAVIDTGVDYTHPDLRNNIWVNSGEIPSNGIDDDNNGYVDDVKGWDFVENDANPMDDNGHGTHVAGIVAMEANGEGGVGLAYGAKVMPIKAAQSNGTLSSSDIAKAVKYAADNGADVINMSFGGTGKSSLVEAALEDAFGTSVLVASAGNDGACTAECSIPGHISEDIYPAGYSYVLGVMSCDADGKLSAFSNKDAIEGIGCEYEIAAPGSSIYSTLPNGRYAKWSGTSMAAPMVSAAAAILRAKNTDKSTWSSRLIMGQLASATGDTVSGHWAYGKLNILDSMSDAPKPDLAIQDVIVLDSPSIDAANNGDGIVQAGETVDLAIRIKNRWGAAKDVTVKADAASVGGVANPHVTFVNDTATIGAVGSFMTADNGFIYENDALSSVYSPIRIKVSDIAPNDVTVKVNLVAEGLNALDSSDTAKYSSVSSKTIGIQNGEMLSGVIKEDKVLTADKLWVLTSSVKVAEGVTLTIEAGTQVQFWPNEDRSDPDFNNTAVYILVDGRLICNGTADEPVQFFTGSGHENQGTIILTSDENAAQRSDGTSSYVELNYVNLTFEEAYNAYWPSDYRQPTKVPFCATTISHCQIDQVGDAQRSGSRLAAGVISDSVINGAIFSVVGDTVFQNVLFSGCSINTDTGSDSVDISFSDCCFYDNCQRSVEEGIYFGVEYPWGTRHNITLSSCSIIDSPQLAPLCEARWDTIRIVNRSSDKEVDISGNYWGTDNPELVKKKVVDADNDVSRGDLIQEPFLTLDSDMSSIYPFVTEAFITDADNNRIEAANCGQQIKLHVKFNRDMAAVVQPLVSFGGSEPWTDYLVTGDWASAREWVGNYTIGSFANQGTMYIRVKDAAAADDTWLKTGTDAARFSFKIEKSSAQSMALQGMGAPGENVLEWAQDDFETFAGYNLYRATVYDPSDGIVEGNFSKLNGSLITENSFIDASVVTGTDYYYYFTVVDTDFNESAPSNVAVCTPLDIDVPIINTKPLLSQAYGNSVVFQADVTDNVSVGGVTLYYRMSGAETWQSVSMRNTIGSTYQVTVASYETSIGQLQYYITATDGTNVTSSGSAELPNVVTIVDPLTVESLALDKQSLSLQVGDTKKLSCTVTPSGVVDPGITWDSNNIAVATVNAYGTVTAQAPGKATITATSKNGKFASCEVYVKKPSQTLIYMTGATASPGETIEVPVSISRNSGIASTNITFEYDPDVFEIVGATANPEAEGYQLSISQDTPAGTKKVLWWGDSNYADDGLLYTLSVKVKVGASVNVDKAITMSCRENDVCDEDKGLVDVYLKGSSISVKELLLGDVYEDGALDVRDIVTLQRYLAKKEAFTSHQVMLGNIIDNGSEEPITVADLLGLAKLLLAA